MARICYYLLFLAGLALVMAGVELHSFSAAGIGGGLMYLYGVLS